MVKLREKLDGILPTYCPYIHVGRVARCIYNILLNTIYGWTSYLGNVNIGKRWCKNVIDTPRRRSSLVECSTTYLGNRAMIPTQATQIDHPSIDPSTLSALSPCSESNQRAQGTSPSLTRTSSVRIVDPCLFITWMLKGGCGVRATTGVVVLRGSRTGKGYNVIIYENKIYFTG